MKLKRTFLLVLLAALAGCSTTPISVQKLNGPYIVFARDSGFVGGGCTFNVVIDGEIVGEVKAGQTVTKAVVSGRHRVGIDNATALCTNVKMSKVVDVARDPVILRIGITANSQTIFDQVE